MFGAMTSLTGGGGLQGGSAGPSTTTSSNQSGQSIGGINICGGVESLAHSRYRGVGHRSLKVLK